MTTQHPATVAADPDRTRGRCGPWAVVRMMMVCLGLLVLAGCGYTQKELYPTEVRSVAVPIFSNRSYYPGVEFDLTEALIKELELRTPYKVVGGDAADTLLQGTITQVQQRTLSWSREEGLPQEMEVRIEVDFVWKNARTGMTLQERRGFAAVGRYVPSTAVGERFSAGQHAAVQKLAADIVSALRANW